MSFPYLLRITDLTVYYANESIPALENFTFETNDKGLIIVAGQSGSGKSTLAKSFLNLLPHNCKISGKIEIDSINILSMNRDLILTKIGFLPQFPMDYILNLLVNDEIAFTLENLGYTKDEIPVLIDETLERLHIAHLKNRLVTEISSGELQKVGLATALISKPKVLILDEPFARMDSNSELSIIELLKELKEETLIIILEHHLDYVLEISDMVFLLDNGKTIAQGTPQEIIHKLNTNKPEISQVHVPGKNLVYINYSDILDDLAEFLANKTLKAL